MCHPSRAGLDDRAAGAGRLGGVARRPRAAAPPAARRPRPRGRAAGGDLGGRTGPGGRGTPGWTPRRTATRRPGPSRPTPGTWCGRLHGRGATGSKLAASLFCRVPVLPPRGGAARPGREAARRVRGAARRRSHRPLRGRPGLPRRRRGRPPGRGDDRLPRARRGRGRQGAAAGREHPARGVRALRVGPDGGGDAVSRATRSGPAAGRGAPARRAGRSRCHRG